MGDRYISPVILDKYLEGTCTPEEAAQVEAWYRSFEDHPEIGNGFPDVQGDGYARSVFRKISEKIKRAELAEQRSVRFRNWAWYAAACLIFGLGIFWQMQRPASQPIANKKNGAGEKSATRFANASQSIQIQVLPDGSKVWLNPDASIHFDPAYGETRREIQLDGEAFFDVKRDQARPFIIHTGQMTTEVLGTSFNVQACPDSRHFEVSVVTGTVSVSGPSGKKIIQARQQVRFDPVSGQLDSFKNAGISRYQLWEPVTINFDWASMRDVTSKLEEMFAVKFEFQNAGMKDCFLRADFTNLRLPVILDLLCESTGATYTIQSGIIRLSGPGC